MTQRKSARSVSCFARGDCLHLLSLQKSGVNMARFKVFGNQKFASFSGWLRGIRLKFSGLTVEKVSIPVIEAILSLKPSIF